MKQKRRESDGGKATRSGETEREREKKEGAGMKKKMGYAPFALRYTAQWKSVRMVIKERQRC